jgi:GTPase SAR1 family protein
MLVFQLELCDTGGMERYNTLSISYFTAASAVIVCYSLVDRASFSAVRYHLDEAVDNASKRNAGGFGAVSGRPERANSASDRHRLSCRPPVSVFLCGTKSDLLANNTPSTDDPSSKVVNALVFFQRLVDVMM